MIIRQRHTYLQPGYVQPGYEASWSPPAGMKHVNHDLMSFDLLRMPSYPEYQLEFNQWQRESGGGQLFVGEPYAVRMYQTLSWPSMPAADLSNWTLFFADVARAQSEQWVWCNPEQGMELPVRFADPEFPESREVGIGYYSVSGLRLMIDINYQGITPSGSHSYTASMGTAFAIGSIIIQLPRPQRSDTGNSLSMRCALEDDSAGQATAQRVGKTRQRPWSLGWDNLSYYEFNWLMGFFATYVRGMQRLFSWYDVDGTAHTVRLASPRITAKQTAYNRFACTLPLIEVF